jgi:phosphoribosylanthranilate isomerase
MHFGVSNLKLKICGMKDPKNIMDVTTLSPDYMGFIFYPRSPRFVGENFLPPKDFPGSIKKVGVFVNETTERIKEFVSAAKLDYVQLHGGESAAQCAELRSEGIRVIKVFSVDDNFDFNQTRGYESSTDYFLFDTKGKYYGGNSTAFDWNVLQRYNQKVPFFLSGGLTPENVHLIGALKTMNIHALDINSGVEISPAVKSIEKIKKVYAILNKLKQVN